MAIEYTRTENVVHTWDLSSDDIAFHIYENNKWLSLTSSGDDHKDGFHVLLNDDTCFVLEAILSHYRNSQSKD